MQHFIDLLKTRFTSLMPCQLCGLDLQLHHSLCHDCWAGLPWAGQQIHRHELDIWVACHYRFPIDRVIQKFKYEEQLHYQQLLAHCLMSLQLPQVDALVAMPISTQRLVERGFNQMLIIAHIISKQLKLPIWQPVIRSAQHAQKGLSRNERIEKIERQFQIIASERHRYQRVLIIDDVVTTGSSLYALTQALGRLGCTEVYSACIAAGKI
ncbi:ComF family protein [Acinetobacter calcoaceticus]|uniref:ComF family protein n=1 Tax=Acinetobacter calcoaceticus TaxID=471 RepID=A0A4R1Y2R6_ACICA|nr:ComF family protein [Acinetobacter calcoaceticus]